MSQRWPQPLEAGERCSRAFLGAFRGSPLRGGASVLDSGPPALCGNPCLLFQASSLRYFGGAALGSNKLPEEAALSLRALPQVWAEQDPE